MDKRALLISAVAGVAGVGLLQIYMDRFEEETSGGPPVPILAAAADIAPGTVVTREMLGVRDLPRAYLEERHIRAADLENVLGVRANQTVKAGESLLWTDLTVFQVGARRLSDLVQEGMRAIAIRASASTLGGLVRPGDRVDVLYTAGAGFDGNGARSTSTLLQNLLVLAVGDDIGGDENEDRTGESATGQVTLGVTAEQGQLLTHAEHQGQLKLVLRNPDDVLLLADLPETSAEDFSGTERLLPWSSRRPAADSERDIEHVR